METVLTQFADLLFNSFSSQMMTSVALISVILVLIHMKQQNSRTAKLINKIPGPPLIPFLGNAMEGIVEHDELFKKAQRLCSQFWPMMRLWVLQQPYVILMEPRHLEVILGNSKHTEKSKDYRFLWPWVGRGLLTSGGQKWHARRKLLTPAFHFQILDDFVSYCDEQAQIFAKNLEKQIGKPSFDICPLATNCTLDIVCSTAMGRNANAQGNGKSDYVTSVHRIAQIIQDRQARFFLQPDILFYFSRHYKVHNECVKHLHAFTRQVIRERKEEIRQHKEMLNNNPNLNDKKQEEGETLGIKKRLAFLDLLIEVSDNGKVLSDEDIREEVDAIMFGGHDTTAAVTSWALFILGNHPEIQDKVVAEQREIFQDSLQGVTMKNLQEMKYLERVIKETLRLFPSAPIIARELQEDADIGEYLVPKGTSIGMLPYVVHRNPEQFPDPEKFDPDRFLQENILKRHPYSFIPWSAGPRNCIGQKFAMIMAKTILSTVLRRFKFESLDRREDLILYAELILRSKNGLHFHITPRSKA